LAPYTETALLICMAVAVNDFFPGTQEFLHPQHYTGISSASSF